MIVKLQNFPYTCICRPDYYTVKMIPTAQDIVLLPVIHVPIMCAYGSTWIYLLSAGLHTLNHALLYGTN